jgi:hypothetical protein
LPNDAAGRSGEAGRHDRAGGEADGEADTGALPVADGDRLVGMIADCDVAIRAVGAGKAPDRRGAT